ncbi:tryptophan 7-halogenase [uncultured Parasphingorhabdus sp.]|uniref:tryptophan 7-halogenase n=1 Tax=uncultured Parasphingorhabdus sp. TaxID=2709694 RepID=UPI002AA913C3|nr:tryptophan 7-halogenase [uncultured Parasphingorhabdus sp.]
MSGEKQRVRRIALFGKSCELWPVAALLAHELPDNIALVLVEDAVPVEPAAVTIRLDDPLLARLGVGAEDLQKTNSAVFTLGCELRDWQHGDSRFFLAGSGTLPAVDDIAIHQIMLRAAELYDQRERLPYLYQPFRLPARALAAGKFAFQSPDPRSPLNMLRPTVQIDRAEYAAMCKQRVDRTQAKIVEARPQAVNMCTDSGTIRRISLDNGAVVDADFFIDLSGDLSRLTNDILNPDWTSIAGRLPFDRLVSASKAGPWCGDDNHVVAQAIEGGLLISAPLRESNSVQLLYRSGIMTSEEAQALVGRDAQESRLDPGYCGRPWNGNLVRLGSASACLGPFLSADMTILHQQTVILADLLPNRSGMAVEARAFNRRQLTVVEQIRDFILLPFALNGRSDGPWSGFASQPMPDSLAKKIDQFRSRGRFVAFEGEIFDEQSWIDLMIGFGVVPRRVDPMALSLDMTTMPRRLKILTGAFDRVLAAMPLSGDVPDRHGFEPFT